MPIQRIYVVKRAPHNVAAEGLKKSLKEDLGITGLETLKILNRYDIECPDIDKLAPSLDTVFAERMVDDLFIEDYPYPSGSVYFAAEYLPGQYDQRSDSAEQCVKVMTGDDSVKVASAKVYVMTGNVSKKELEAIKNYIINKIDQREASLKKPKTLAIIAPAVKPVETVHGFIQKDDAALSAMLLDWGLAMNLADLQFCRDYFANEEKRDPTETEIKLLDTYWSDHCRHTTFNTELTNIKIVDGAYKAILQSALDNYLDMRHGVYGKKIKTKQISLMDIATIGAKFARKKGHLDNLEISDENNACSIEIDVRVKRRTEKWLLQFKNETHNHPTEIEPFGGAATCLGGAIRDPLSGRAYVYHAMRITGAADPRKSISETLAGKLPQYKITKDAAHGFSSYGNQIGLATGYVQEHYHDGFAAKRMEAGAVIGAVPKENVRREKPAPTDQIILIGGRTGRDGIGGATGSSKEHDASSIDVCGAEVQKGNAPEEHKIQRLFRNPKVSKMIKKCNDFGAGGVGVAIGELADGLLINLNAVPKKYSGLTGTEIAISESQERMAAVVSKDDAKNFISECSKENLEATIVAEVTDTERLQMKHDDKLIVDISRKFLDSAGAPRSQTVVIENPEGEGYFTPRVSGSSLKEVMDKTLSSLNICSQKGLVEMFDSTIGAGSVTTPFGGEYANTPSEYMAAKIPVQGNDTPTISVMSAGYNPDLSSWSCFHGGFYAVVESVAKLIVAGAELKDIRLSFQEYFERLGTDDKKWGKPLSSLLGALKAQKMLKLAAIGGKDSMSGTFKDKTTGAEINVPPTLISFAVAPSDSNDVVPQQFEKAKSRLWLIKTPIDKYGMIERKKFIKNASFVSNLIKNHKVQAVYTIKSGGIIEAVAKMAFGDMVGVNFHPDLTLEELTFPYYGSFLIQTTKTGMSADACHLGDTTVKPFLTYKEEKIPLSELLETWEKPLEHVFPSKTDGSKEILAPRDYSQSAQKVHANITIKPTVAILALPGTNCEYDMQRAFQKAGSRKQEPFIFRNMTAYDAQESCAMFAKLIRKSQIVAIPGGFSAGDEPEGSGKFYVSVFKNPRVKDAIHDLLHKRDGLMIGICNGFQALLKTGLLTYGEICELDQNDATLTFNKIGRHVSQIVRTRVASRMSPWLALHRGVERVPVSHGEGRFTAPKAMIDKMFEQGQVAFQYVDTKYKITMESPYNPNGSEYAIEGITSPDGRILGKMAHSERTGFYVHKNNHCRIEDLSLFEAGVQYFK